MKKIRLTESELTHLIKRVIKENKEDNNQLKEYMKNPIFKKSYNLLKDLHIDVSYCETLEDIEESYNDLSRVAERIDKLIQMDSNLAIGMVRVLQKKLTDIELNLESKEEDIENSNYLADYGDVDDDDDFE